MRVSGLDGAALAAVAARIGAPTPAEVATAPESIPDDGGLLAFRQFGPWA